MSLPGAAGRRYGQASTSSSPPIATSASRSSSKLRVYFASLPGLGAAERRLGARPAPLPVHLPLYFVGFGGLGDVGITVNLRRFQGCPVAVEGIGQALPQGQLHASDFRMRTGQVGLTCRMVPWLRFHKGTLMPTCTPVATAFRVSKLYPAAPWSWMFGMGSTFSRCKVIWS